MSAFRPSRLLLSTALVVAFAAQANALSSFEKEHNGSASATTTLGGSSASSARPAAASAAAAGPTSHLSGNPIGSAATTAPATTTDGTATTGAGAVVAPPTETVTPMAKFDGVKLSTINGRVAATATPTATSATEPKAAEKSSFDKEHTTGSTSTTSTIGTKNKLISTPPAVESSVH